MDTNSAIQSIVKQESLLCRKNRRFGLTPPFRLADDRTWRENQVFTHCGEAEYTNLFNRDTTAFRCFGFGHFKFQNAILEGRLYPLLIDVIR